MLFVDDLAIELMALKFLLFELLVAPSLKCAETLIEAPRAAAIEPDRGAGQVGQQPFVVADQRERRAAVGKARLKPLDGDQVKVVGRLVEQQDVGFWTQRPDQRRPTGFAAGKPIGIGSRVDPKFGQHRSCRIWVVEFSKPSEHIVESSGETGHVRLLRQVGEARGRLDEAGSAVSCRLARRDTEQRRLARSVASNDGNAVASGNRQLRPVQKRRAAQRQASVSQL